jgi:hypothetical protein
MHFTNEESEAVRGLINMLRVTAWGSKAIIGAMTI